MVAVKRLIQESRNIGPLSPIGSPSKSVLQNPTGSPSKPVLQSPIGSPSKPVLQVREPASISELSSHVEKTHLSGSGENSTTSTNNATSDKDKSEKVLPSGNDIDDTTIVTSSGDTPAGTQITGVEN